jgi:hypothetical protein
LIDILWKIEASIDHILKGQASLDDHYTLKSGMRMDFDFPKSKCEGLVVVLVVMLIDKRAYHGLEILGRQDVVQWWRCYIGTLKERKKH